MIFWKPVQRRVYSLLSDRTSFLTFVVVTALLLYGFASFGEAWLEWSSDKYAAVFNSFSDNIIGRSLRGSLCQYVPVDVVYTWVNGSDPWFIDGLKHVKEELLVDKNLTPITLCPYKDCFPSHFITTRELLPKYVKPSYLKEQNKFLMDLVDIENQHLQCDVHLTNRTFLDMGSSENAVKANRNHSEVAVGIDHYDIVLAHWTSEWSAPHTFKMPGYFLLFDIPPSATEFKLVHALPDHVSEVFSKMWLDTDRQAAVIRLSNKTIAQRFVEENPQFSLGSVDIRLASAYILVETPRFYNEDGFAPSRYNDNEELRYSIRSVEKYAPWVRHIYLVTNGQIPYWLNLDSPRLTVVTHEEIFPDSSHLPTFSSSAIEANIHRIPGLSEKFIYMNDDVFFGKDVWPNDFYTDQNGQKIYFAWQLPDCSPECPQSWIKDGFCDTPCNTTECLFDGGDCSGPNVRMGFGDPNVDHAFHWRSENDNKDLCAITCLDTWINDGFCDDGCNTGDCGYDGGDCGTKRFPALHQIPFNFDLNAVPSEIVLPLGVNVAFMNVSHLFDKYDEVGLVPIQHQAVRTLTLNDKNKVITLVLYPDTLATLNVTLQAKSQNKTEIAEFSIRGNTTGHQHIVDPTDPPKNATTPAPLLPADIEQIQGGSGFDYSRADVSLLDLNQEELNNMLVISQQLEREEITLKGYKIRKSAILKGAVQRYISQGRPIEALGMRGEIPPPGDAKTKNADPEMGSKAQTNVTKNHIAGKNLTARAEQLNSESSLASNKPISSVAPGRKLLKMHMTSRAHWEDSSDSSSTVTFQSRKVLDTYADSLKYVNRLYGQHYGVLGRNVVSHMPHFLDKAVVEDMMFKFDGEWKKTSSHRIRTSQDMQYAFAYFHFIVNEKKPFEIEAVFDEFDTDRSGTWSDREIRTLLTKIHQLPLASDIVHTFDNLIITCAMNASSAVLEREAPPYDRYYDSKLPVVSRELIIDCKNMIDHLSRYFPDRHRYKHEVVSNPDVVFKRLTSNTSHVVSTLDDLRKHPKKFICINDDRNYDSSDDEMVRALLIDYFESVLPVPSSFELPQEYRNKFLHLSELATYKLVRKLIHVITYVCTILLVILILLGYFNIDMDVYLMMVMNKFRGKKPASHNV